MRGRKGKITKTQIEVVPRVVTEKEGILCVRLSQELRNEPNEWQNYLKMDEGTYLELLSFISLFIVKHDTVMRRVIFPHERLSATL